MGFFRNLWDEKLAGPTSDSESGVGKLHRYKSLLARSSIPSNGVSPSQAEDNTPVSRSITVLRTNSLSVAGPGTPSSPSGPSTPGSPFSATSPGGGFKKLARRKSTAEAVRKEPKSPTGYDWIVLTSLDR